MYSHKTKEVDSSTVSTKKDLTQQWNHFSENTKLTFATKQTKKQEKNKYDTSFQMRADLTMALLGWQNFHIPIISLIDSE